MLDSAYFVCFFRRSGVEVHFVGEDFATRPPGCVVRGYLDHDLVQVLDDVLELFCFC